MKTIKNVPAYAFIDGLNIATTKLAVMKGKKNQNGKLEILSN